MDDGWWQWMMDDDDGRWWKMMEEKSWKMWGKKHFFLKLPGTIWGPSGGYQSPKKNYIRPKLQLFFQSLVIERYAYQSIRTDLIKLSRPVLHRFDKKKKLKKLQKTCVSFAGGCMKFAQFEHVKSNRCGTAWTSPGLPSLPLSKQDVDGLVLLLLHYYYTPLQN